MERSFKLVLVMDPIPVDYDHGHEKEEKTGVYGARTRNLRRDRAAL
jgi:hypothetical protein